MNTMDEGICKAAAIAILCFTLNPVSTLAQDNSTAQGKVQEGDEQSTKKAGKRGELSLSGAVDFFKRMGGSGVKPNVSLGGEVRYTGNHVGFGLTSMLDMGYLGDIERSGDFGKVFSETHGYLSIGNLPFSAASELYTLSNPKVKGLSAGVATKPIGIGRVKVSAEFYPFSNQPEREFALYGNAKLSERLSAYGMGKNFFKAGEDTRFGNAGAKFDLGKGFHLKGEYRNWPMKTSHGAMRRDHSFYLGIGYRGSFKK